MLTVREIIERRQLIIDYLRYDDEVPDFRHEEVRKALDDLCDGCLCVEELPPLSETAA